MKLIIMLVPLVAALTSVASEPATMLLDDAQRILGTSIVQMRNDPDMSVQEHLDFVDEDEFTILNEKWLIRWPNGLVAIATTDDGIATSLEIRSRGVRIDRDVRVGDTLAMVKAAFPDSEFQSGSKSELSESLTMYAKQGSILFVFEDQEIWNSLRDGKTFRFDDPEVADIELFSIRFQDGNRYACEEQFPCPLFPERYNRD